VNPDVKIKALLKTLYRMTTHLLFSKDMDGKSFFTYANTKSVMLSYKSIFGRLCKKFAGKARKSARNEAYFWVRRSIRTFYKAVKE
jgi:hypothetical protein